MASTSNTRIPIKLSPHLFASTRQQDITPTYHALVHDTAHQLGGAARLSSSSSGNTVNNGSSSSSTISLNAADGMKLDGKMNATDLHDYVLLYDDASRSYVLHKLSSVTRLQPSGSTSSAGTKPITPNARSKAAEPISSNSNSNTATTLPASGNNHSPAIARTPQSTNSPSIPASSSKTSNTARARQASSTGTSYLSPSAGGGTAKKLAASSQKKHSNSGYDSSPTPSTVGKTYGLGISSAAGAVSPSAKNAPPSNNAIQRGKAPMQDVEEFDMGTSDEDLHSSRLQLPPSQGSLPKPSSRPLSQQPTRPLTTAPSTSLSMFSSNNTDVVMSDSSTDDEDEGDFADLANDLESSLVGQGPFSRTGVGAGAGAGAAGRPHTLISSDDEDDDDDSDFVNALAEQSATASRGQPNQRPPLPQSQPARPQQQQQQQQQQAQSAASQSYQQQQQQQRHQPPNVIQPASQTSRPSQAGKKLPTTSARKYDSDIASSSESDDSD